MIFSVERISPYQPCSEQHHCSELHSFSIEALYVTSLLLTWHTERHCQCVERVPSMRERVTTSDAIVVRRTHMALKIERRAATLVEDTVIQCYIDVQNSIPTIPYISQVHSKDVQRNMQTNI